MTDIETIMDDPWSYWASYGNGKGYIAARLQRDGFDRLARAVRNGKLSAQFAKELAKTVPRDQLDAVTTAAIRWGPRRPIAWEWETAAELLKWAEDPERMRRERDQQNQADSCQVENHAEGQTQETK